MVRAYALITPARDEVENLRRLGSCVLAQTVRPAAWIVVDNGSVDGTRDYVAGLATERPWVSYVSAPAAPTAQPGAPIVVAFHMGLGTLAEPVDMVVKLDADVSMEPDYFQRLLEAFDADERLGIASGVCLEQEGEEWKPTHVTEAHVRGATRCYRSACLQDVLPLEERMGWDSIDELKAQTLGWTTCIVRDASFRHHRRVGERDGRPWARWSRQGDAAYYIGYRFPYLVLRTLHHTRRNPAAAAMLAAYLSSWARRRPRYADPAVREHLRDRQHLRNIPLRAREALGRRPD